MAEMIPDRLLSGANAGEGKVFALLQQRLSCAFSLQAMCQVSE